MGIIERQIRKGGNQKLAAPRFLDTRKSSADVVETVTAIAAGFNAKATAAHEDRAVNGNRLVRWAANGTKPNLLHVEERAQGQCLVTWRYNFATIQARPKAVKEGGFWLATVDFHPGAEGRPNSVELTLLRWVINQDGKIQNRDVFERFVDQLAAQLAV